MSATHRMPTVGREAASRAELEIEARELWERAGDGDGLDPAESERLAAIRAELDRDDERPSGPSAAARHPR